MGMDLSDSWLSQPQAIVVYKRKQSMLERPPEPHQGHHLIPIDESTTYKSTISRGADHVARKLKYIKKHMKQKPIPHIPWNKADPLSEMVTRADIRYQIRKARELIAMRELMEKVNKETTNELVCSSHSNEIASVATHCSCEWEKQYSCGGRSYG
jgi:hypothetical protein